MNAIKTTNLCKYFGSGSERVVALDDVSVEINENEFFTLLGPSGCGKTTLLRLIAGFETPDAGNIDLYGEGISHLPPYQRPVNTVFQNYALFPHMSVLDNVRFGLEMLDKPKQEIYETADRMLELVQMQALRNRQTSQISGGQQQRVALARALAPHPKVLLLDEPLSALDFKLRKEMQLELKRLQATTGITFVFVTHDQEEALTMSDRIAVMNEGRIRQTGTPREIYDHPAERFVSDFIGESNYLTASVLTSNGNNTDTWAVIFEPPEELKGKINVVPEMNDVINAALFYKGFPYCNSDKKQLKEVNDMLLSAKQHWLSMEYGNVERFANEDIHAGVNWNGASMRSRLQNDAIRYGYPKEGIGTWADNVVVLADAKNADNAKLFQNFIMDPENAALISDFAKYANGISGSLEFLDPDFANAPEIAPPDHYETVFVPPCPQEVNELYTRIWTNLLK